MFGETLNCCLKVLCFAGWGEGWVRSPLCGLPWRVSNCAGKPLNFRIQKTFLCDGSVSAAKMPPASAFGDYKPGCPCSRGRRGRGREDTHLSCVETVTQPCYQTCTLSLAGILLLGAGSGWGGGVQGKGLTGGPDETRLSHGVQTCLWGKGIFAWPSIGGDLGYNGSSRRLLLNNLWPHPTGASRGPWFNSGLRCPLWDTALHRCSAFPIGSVSFHWLTCL